MAWKRKGNLSEEILCSQVLNAWFDLLPANLFLCLSVIHCKVSLIGHRVILFCLREENLVISTLKPYARYFFSKVDTRRNNSYSFRIAAFMQL